MTRTPRVAFRRPGMLLVAESVLLAVVLTATSGLIAAPALADPGASAEASTEPSPGPTTEAPSMPPPASDPPTDAPPTDAPPTAAPTEPAPSEPPPAPEPTLDPEPTATADPSLPPDPTAAPTPDPSAAPTEPPARGLHVDHVWMDTVDRRSGASRVGAIDEPLTGAQRGQLYVVRFRIVNDAETQAVIRPALEFGFADDPAWTIVPAIDPVPGVALYTSANVLQGDEAGSEPMAVGDLRLKIGLAESDGPAPGSSNAGTNPGRRLTLEAHEFTEVEFTVRATSSAPWLVGYGLRLTDAGQPLAGANLAKLELGGRPLVKLTPGQRSGIDVDEPGAEARSDRGRVVWRLAAAAAFTTPHGDYTLATDKCAACHATHTAAGPMLGVQPPPQSNLCFTCHDGTGSTIDVSAQYTDPAVPPNDEGAGTWYSHAATTATSHTSDRDETEFAGRLERHAACADCHQPHRADASLAVQTAGGWTASGALLGAAGVEVVNGPAGTAPSYTWRPEATLEYQLCFKCHSGFTELAAQTGGPSTWALDKGVELNPANLSYHPVEAPGTNNSTRMAGSLSGTSPYKLWAFTVDSTVRCVNCHGDSRKANPAAPPDPGARLAPHAVPNRSMLLANLRDRLLKNPSDAYQASDFALCYACHAEAPFVDTSQSPRLDTNFPVHGTHTAGIASFSGPLAGTVDDDGAGRGNAICAECHFRTHGTSYAVDGQTPERRLVSFSPNVQPYGGPNVALQGILDYDDDGNSCTLRCHGVDHAAWSY